MNKIDPKQLRKRLNLTQHEMAALLGVHKATVWRWEKYGIPPRGTVAYLLKSLCDQEQRPPIIKTCKSSGVDHTGKTLQP
ncbi:helix-turn-helix domain-containing protein [Bartonella rattaustraliani]|uniref:helix-turn-helix domain-containing protein n=1 Tax=Bartonella rattaustraliani TaxID=481139 RepID=UPI0003114C8F|nr:helix-turn-helix transcriptional regulator [Bartonella rattaustraliani]